MKSIEKQTGIALIQVLLLTAILSVLAMYFTHTSRQQVALAIDADNRASALINIQNAKNQLIFDLMTSEKVPVRDREITNNSATNWNFFGQTFRMSDMVTAELQDLSGLLNSHFLDIDYLNQVLQANNVSESQAMLISQSLIDWQDLDNLTATFTVESSLLGNSIRNGKVPDLTDFKHIPSLDDNVYSLLQNILTLHFVGRFNPMSAPNELLKGLISDDAFQQIKMLREKGTISNDIFSNITGIIESEDIWFTPSNFLKLTLSSEIGSVEVERTWAFSLNPHATHSSPINYFEIRG